MQLVLGRFSTVVVAKACVVVAAVVLVASAVSASSGESYDLTNARPWLGGVNAKHSVSFVDEYRPGCPSLTKSCTRGQATALRGEELVVSGERGMFAYAYLTRRASESVMTTTGWLPRWTVTRVASATEGASAWAGLWRNGAAIRIKARRDGRVDIRGELVLYAATITNGRGTYEPNFRFLRADAQRVSSSVLTFTPRDEECVVRMWRLGPYLFVMDDGRCSGSFSGIYRRERR